MKSVTVAELHPDGLPIVRTYTKDPSMDDLTFQSEMGSSCGTDANVYYDAQVNHDANMLCVTGTGSASLSSLVNGGTFGTLLRRSAARERRVRDLLAKRDQLNVGEEGVISEITQGTDTCVQLTCETGDFLCTIMCRGYQKHACYSDSVDGSKHNLYCQEHLECP